MTNQTPAASLRLFVAMTLPEMVRNEIIRVQQELQPLVSRAAARWTRPDQFHLTLRFLGRVPADAVAALKQAVGAICRNAPPLSLCAQGVGFFPGARSPRVVWAGISDREGRLVDLQQRIETAVGPFSPEPGGNHFAGHVTLGRLKNPRPSNVRSLVAGANRFAAHEFGRWLAAEVEIIRSELSPSGSRHTSLAVFRLDGGTGPAAPV